MTKIKPAKYFLLRLNKVSLLRRVVITTKIKPCKNATGEMFYRRKFLIYGNMFIKTLVLKWYHTYIVCYVSYINEFFLFSLELYIRYK